MPPSATSSSTVSTTSGACSRTCATPGWIATRPMCSRACCKPMAPSRACSIRAARTGAGCRPTPARKQRCAPGRWRTMCSSAWTTRTTRPSTAFRMRSRRCPAWTRTTRYTAGARRRWRPPIHATSATRSSSLACTCRTRSSGTSSW